MNSREALRVIFSNLKKEPAIIATGYLCRAAQKVHDRPSNFYMIGSMGMASSIGLGIALAKRQKKVVVLDGDGAVLMNLGHLPMAGALKAGNLVHVVIDNARYESTGNQPSLTKTVKLEAIARASGYRLAARVHTRAELQKKITLFLSKKGPSFLLVRVEPDTAEPPPRVRATPEAITAAFSKSLK